MGHHRVSRRAVPGRLMPNHHGLLHNKVPNPSLQIVFPLSLHPAIELRLCLMQQYLLHKGSLKADRGDW